MTYLLDQSQSAARPGHQLIFGLGPARRLAMRNKMSAVAATLVPGELLIDFDFSNQDFSFLSQLAEQGNIPFYFFHPEDERSFALDVISSGTVDFDAGQVVRRLASAQSNPAEDLIRLKNLAKRQSRIPANKWVTFAEMQRTGGIILVGRNHWQPANPLEFTRLMYRLVSSELLDLPPSSHPVVHLFIDNLASLGRLPGLELLMMKATERGIQINLAAYNLPGLAMVYDERVLESILLSCASLKVIGSSCASPEAIG